MDDIDVKVEQEILRIAREHRDKKPVVKSVFRGIHPVEKRLTYWFISGSSMCDRDLDALERELAEFEAEYFRKTHRDLNALVFPINPDEAGNYDFLGESIYCLEQERAESGVKA